MIFKNKKGDFLTSILMIIIMLTIFFMLQGSVASLVTEMVGFAPDSIAVFMLQLLVPAILLGVVKFIFSLGRAGQ